MYLKDRIDQEENRSRREYVSEEEASEQNRNRIEIE